MPPLPQAAAPNLQCRGRLHLKEELEVEALPQQVLPDLRLWFLKRGIALRNSRIVELYAENGLNSTLSV